MEGGAFLDKEFAALADRAVLFCHVTTHVAGDPHPDLWSEKGGKGFPHIVVLDADGRLLARHAASRTPAELGKTVDRGRRHLDLRSKGEAGDRTARLDFLEAALPEEVLEDAEIERRRKELGALAPGEEARLSVAAARRRMKALQASRAVDHADIVKEADLILRHVPDDAEAHAAAAWACRNLNQADGAARHVEAALAKRPDDLDLRVLAIGIYVSQTFFPLAQGHLDACAPLLEKGSDSLKGYLETQRKQLKRSGADRYEVRPARRVGDLEMTAFRAAGQERDPKAPAEQHAFVFRRAGASPWVVRHVTAPPPGGEAQLVLMTLEGSHILRRAPKPWTEEEAADLAAASAGVVPHILDAGRYRRWGVPPLLHKAVSEGLKADPESLTLKGYESALRDDGWDACELEATRPMGKSVVEAYRPTGRDRKPGRWIDERVLVVREEGAFRYAYAVQSFEAGGRVSRYETVRLPGEMVTARRPAETPSLDDLMPVVAAFDAALAPYREGVALLNKGQKQDAVTPDLLGAEEPLKRAIRAAPAFLDAAAQLVQCYLAITDRERDPDRTDALYPRAIGAVMHLSRLDPTHATGLTANGVFAYRFNAFPTAVHYLKLAGMNERAREILTILRDTGQDQYRHTGTWAAEGFDIHGYERVRRGDEKDLEGLQLADHCFIGIRDGLIRFTACYRVQRIGDAVERDLLFSRHERSVVARTFKEEPSLDDLKTEVGGLLGRLKPPGTEKK